MKASPRLVVNDLVREVFLFPSGGESLYGSLYAGHSPGLCLVICPAWGWESTWTLDGVHRLGLEASRQGAAALVFHWPGHGDSEGEAEDTTIERLVGATVDAVGAAAGRLPDVTWGLAGVRLGAAAAVLAAPAVGARRLLLVQPSLDAGGWLSELDRLAGEASPGWFGGFPLSDGFRRSAQQTSTIDAVARFRGSAAVVRYRQPAMSGLPVGWLVRTIPGEWRRYIRTYHPELFQAAADCLEPPLEE